MVGFTIARNKRRPSEPLFAEPDVGAARTEAIKAARIASNRIVAERLERAIRTAERDAAGIAFPAAADVGPAHRRSAA